MAREPQRILIIRLSAIGDVIMASGLIPALRSLWPNAFIAWLAEDTNAELLQQNPRLDRVHVLPRREWRGLRKAGAYGGLLRAMRDFTVELRAERYDLVLDLQGLLKSGVWAFASGANQRIGLGSREGSQFLMTEVIARVMDDPRIGKEYRDLAIRLGADEANFVMDIPVPDGVRESASGILTKAGVNGDYAVLAPFTTRPQKHWFDERWAGLARGLGSQFQLVMLGGPADRARAAGIQSMAKGLIVNLVGETSLLECAALIEGARVLVGVDTGLTHLGTAMPTPTVALFGSTSPYLDTTRRDGVVLYVPRACSPCHRRPTCEGQFDCMRVHGVESVLEAVNGVLTGSGLVAESVG